MIFSQPSHAGEPMLSDAFLNRLDLLALRMKHPASGGSGGLRRSKALGSSVEFSDFREYAAGDDIRRLDWNAYARFDRLFLKLFMEEQEQRVNIIVDGSASMDFGEPSKWESATKLAEMLCYLSLCGGDRVMLYVINGPNIVSSRPLSGRQSYPAASEFLARITPSGQSELALPSLSLPQGRGLSVLISDMLYEAGYERPLQSLLYRKQEISILQLWSHEEWEPTLDDTVELVDSETNQTHVVTTNFDLLKRYRQTAAAYLAELQQYCRSHAITHAFMMPEPNFEDQLLRELSQLGLIG